MAEKLTMVERTFWGRFANPWDTWKDTRLHAAFVLGFNSGDPDYSPSPSDPRLPMDLPIRKPKFGPVLPNASTAGIRLTWLGHASVLVYIDGVNVLCDPVFSERCSASQYFGPRRYRPPPCQVKDLPQVDAIVISHNHYDHMDYASIHSLGERFPKAYWFVPSGCRDFILSSVNEASGDHVREFLWWEEQPIGDTGVKVIFTPTQHWSARNLVFDSFSTLWGSWALIGARHRFWFGGDTGYCKVFKEIGAHLGPFDVAAIPIGAYKPRSVLKTQHVDPVEAVQIHKDIKAKYSVGVHWGTFPLSHESYMAPKLDLLKAVKAAGLSPSDFRTLDHGRSLCFYRESDETVFEE
ncbi:unnamed protein product [Mesocestoides corti]|nr:unnamed protein product [Mesocestoides corti]